MRGNPNIAITHTYRERMLGFGKATMVHVVAQRPSHLVVDCALRDHIPVTAEWLPNLASNGLEELDRPLPQPPEHRLERCGVGPGVVVIEQHVIDRAAVIDMLCRLDGQVDQLLEFRRKHREVPGLPGLHPRLEALGLGPCALSHKTHGNSTSAIVPAAEVSHATRQDRVLRASQLRQPALHAPVRHPGMDRFRQQRQLGTTGLCSPGRHVNLLVP